ncbi:MAG: transposase [Halopseudomonas sp.]|jgi:transposase
MSTQRLTLKFRAEAVRQVVERGYSLAEIAARLGGSNQGFYKWVKAVTSDKSERQASELLEAKSEILRLRAQMRSLEEERDILIKAARYLAREPE